MEKIQDIQIDIYEECENLIWNALRQTLHNDVVLYDTIAKRLDQKNCFLLHHKELTYVAVEDMIDNILGSHSDVVKNTKLENLVEAHSLLFDTLL